MAAYGQSQSSERALGVEKLNIQGQNDLPTKLHDDPKVVIAREGAKVAHYGWVSALLQHLNFMLDFAASALLRTDKYNQLINMLQLIYVRNNTGSLPIFMEQVSEKYNKFLKLPWAYTCYKVIINPPEY